MFWITAILFFLSLNQTCKCKSHLRVLDGRDAKDGEFPFVVLLLELFTQDTSRGQEANLYRACTGSIISENWILTAGHCVAHTELESLYMQHTNFTTPHNSSAAIKKVRKIIIHPSYIEATEEETFLNNDISLLLVDKLAMNSFGRLLAVDHLTMIGLPVTFIGGGGTNKPGDDEFRPLQVGEAGIASCSQKHEFAKYIICLATKCENKLHMPWYGDSGGPLLYKGRIIGVCSFGNNNTVMTEEVYAAVSPHIDWIYKVMQK